MYHSSSMPTSMAPSHERPKERRRPASYYPPHPPPPSAHQHGDYMRGAPAAPSYGQQPIGSRPLSSSSSSSMSGRQHPPVYDGRPGEHRIQRKPVRMGSNGLSNGNGLGISHGNSSNGNNSMQQPTMTMPMGVSTTSWASPTSSSSPMTFHSEPGWKLHHYDHIKLRSPLSPAPSCVVDSNSSSSGTCDSRASSMSQQQQPPPQRAIPRRPLKTSHSSGALSSSAAVAPLTAVSDEESVFSPSHASSSAMGAPRLPMHAHRPRRHSQNDLLSCSQNSMHEKRASTPKLRRVLSAKPCVKQPPPMPLDDSSAALPDDDIPPLTRDENPSPSFWNPRTEQDIMPVKRTLSRRLRGLLQPQKAKLDGTSKDQHLASQHWSVTRPMTPMDDIDFYNDALLDEPDNGMIANPFYMISRSWAMGDCFNLDLDNEDFTQMDTYASNVQQRGSALTPKLLTLKFLVRPYRRELYRLRVIFTWIMLNIAIVDQRSDEERRHMEEADQWRQQMLMTSTMPVPLASTNTRPTSRGRRWTNNKKQVQQLPDECELELPLLDVMTGQGLLPEGGGAVDAFEEWLFSESSQQVFRRRDCSSSIGMANLFCDMALAAGIQEARVIYGYLRAPKDSFSEASMASSEDDDDRALVQNHAWCCVKVEGEYRFVDCWLAFPSQPQNKYQIEDHWFLAKPSDMIYTHFPYARVDQCLEPAISVKAFFDLPYVWPSFFEHHFKLIRFNPSTLTMVDDQVCHLTIRVDPDTVCFAMVEAESGQLMRTLAQCRNAQTEDGVSERVYKIKAVLPTGATRGWLKIFAAPSAWLDTHLIQRQDDPYASNGSGTSSSSSSSSSSNNGGSGGANGSGNNSNSSSSNNNSGGSISLSPPAGTTVHPPGALTLELPPLAVAFPLHHRQSHPAGRSNNLPFEFVHVHPCRYEFNVQEPQCYFLYPLQTYNFLIHGGESHHKLAIRSPSGKLFKLMSYPQEHTYDGSVTLGEVGKWTLICLLHQSTGWFVIASWMCVHPQ
ncbi:hypothetical protein BC940DRAFT_320725 [Gongronella butleri]|nr:hypothetical protein BC940DRAFT_320725 [Gongronella butleri]